MSKRKAIPLKTKLAAALACLLPQAQRDELRANRVSPEMVISLFRQDHIVPHADGGSDEWWNIDPLLTAVHEEKTAKIDVPRIAKGKRLRAKEAEHRRRREEWMTWGCAAPRPIPPDTQKRPRPKHRLQSRPFDKRHRPMRAGRKVTQIAKL